MKNGQIFLAAGANKEDIDSLIKMGWMEADEIEGVGLVYTLTKEGFQCMVHHMRVLKKQRKENQNEP